MSLQDDIFEAQKQAMKSGDKERVTILRNASAAIKNAQIEKQGELTDEDVQQVIARQVKQLTDAMADFEKGGRDDLVAQNKGEIEILSSYLPAQLSDEEVEATVTQVLEGLGPKERLQMGQAMGAAMKELKGKADGNRVKAAVMAYLNT